MCRIAFNICFVITGRSGQTFKKRPFSGIFNSLGHFPKIFEQVKEPRKLELCGKIRLLHLFLYPMKFYLLCDQGQQGGVLNPTKYDQFQVFLAVVIFFPKLLGMLRDGLLWNCTKS